jgi:hypothetical protein
LAASGGELPAASAAGRRIDGLVLDLDATIVVCHSEKESATPTWKKTFGYHPLRCSLDNTGEALSGLLRKGRAGSNTTADHILVLKQALAQIPETHRYGHEILVRTDSAGCTHGLLAYIRRLRKKGIRARFSVGVAITEPVREAIRQARDWIPAIDLDGELREGAEVCELTGLVPADGYPKGTRSSCAANDPSSWRPVTAPTPASRTASAAARTPGSAASRPACSRSTRPGFSWRWSRST